MICAPSYTEGVRNIITVIGKESLPTPSNESLPFVTINSEDYDEVFKQLTKKVGIVKAFVTS